MRKEKAENKKEKDWTVEERHICSVALSKEILIYCCFETIL